MFITFKASRWAEEDLAKRIGQLMYGDPWVWRNDDSATRWQIGTANDLWLHPKGDETYVLHYRYPTEERIKALAVMLAWRLGIELLPNDR